MIHRMFFLKVVVVCSMIGLHATLNGSLNQHIEDIELAIIRNPFATKKLITIINRTLRICSGEQGNALVDFYGDMYRQQYPKRCLLQSAFGQTTPDAMLDCVAAYVFAGRKSEQPPLPFRRKNINALYGRNRWCLVANTAQDIQRWKENRRKT